MAAHGHAWPYMRAGQKEAHELSTFRFLVLACFDFFNLRKNFSFFVLACFHFFNFEAHELSLFRFLLSRAFTFSTSEKNFRFWRSRAFNFSTFALTCYENFQRKKNFLFLALAR